MQQFNQIRIVIFSMLRHAEGVKKK